MLPVWELVRDGIECLDIVSRHKRLGLSMNERPYDRICEMVHDRVLKEVEELRISATMYVDEEIVKRIALNLYDAINEVVEINLGTRNHDVEVIRILSDSIIIRLR